MKNKKAVVPIRFPITHYVDDYHEFDSIKYVYLAHGLNVDYVEIDVPDEGTLPYGAIFNLKK